tara:strand:+ start:1010 stop:1150 length:141 start_codon:yes stop_codon:yes gene_type:complete
MNNTFITIIYKHPSEWALNYLLLRFMLTGLGRRTREVGLDPAPKAG